MVGAQKVTSYAYDALDNLTSLTDASGNVTQWVYDGLSRLIEEIDPLLHSTFYTYDASGDLATKTDRDGRVTEYDYDGLGRLIEERWLDATQTVIETIDYTYDLMSRLLTATDSDSSLTYTYDDAGRLLTASNGGVTMPLTVLTSTYDDLGNRDSLSAVIGTTADFTNDYLYDALGRMTQVTQHGTTGGNTVADKRVDLHYDGLNRFTSVDRYADLAGTELVATTEYAYDPRGRLSRLRNTAGTTLLSEYSYLYDAADRLVRAKGPSDTVTYHYDPSGQLTVADHSSQDDENYGYDKTGNRDTTDDVVGDGNRYLEDTTFQYQYDNEGNLTQKTDKATGDYTLYTWDYHNQLTRVELYDSSDNLISAVEYDYDAMGRRIRRQVDSDGDSTFDAAQKFVYDGTQVVLVFDDTNAVTERMLWGPQVDQLFAQEDAVNDVLWALTDNLGSVRQVVEYNGSSTTIADTLDYDAFGNVTSESTPANSPLFKFTGRYFDDVTGLQYNWHRWYDPAVGRWISEDPIGYEGGDVNLSRYVGNSPTNATDPTGLQEAGAYPNFPTFSYTGPVDVVISVTKPDDPAGTIASAFYGGTGMLGMNEHVVVHKSPTVDYDDIINDIIDEIGTSQINTLTITSHGGPNICEGLLGMPPGGTLGAREKEFLGNLGSLMSPSGTIRVQACCIGNSPDKRFPRQMAQAAGVRVVFWDGLYAVVPHGREFTAYPDGSCRQTGDTGRQPRNSFFTQITGGGKKPKAPPAPRPTIPLPGIPQSPTRVRGSNGTYYYH